MQITFRGKTHSVDDVSIGLISDDRSLHVSVASRKAAGWLQFRVPKSQFPLRSPMTLSTESLVESLWRLEGEFWAPTALHLLKCELSDSRLVADITCTFRREVAGEEEEAHFVFDDAATLQPAGPPPDQRRGNGTVAYYAEKARKSRPGLRQAYLRNIAKLGGEEAVNALSAFLTAHDLVTPLTTAEHTLIEDLIGGLGD